MKKISTKDHWDFLEEKLISNVIKIQKKTVQESKLKRG